MHIPVIIGAILEGPIVGVYRFGFRALSLYTAVYKPGPLTFVFLNPLVSLPRILYWERLPTTFTLGCKQIL